MLYHVYYYANCVLPQDSVYADEPVASHWDEEYDLRCEDFCRRWDEMHDDNEAEMG